MIYGNVFSNGRSNNSLFEEEDKIHRYNPSHTMRLLRNTLLARGIEINTPDLNAGREVAFDLHIEGRPLAEDGIPKYLIALENPYYNPLNADREYCRHFRKIFAWDKRLHDLPNAVPIMVPNILAYDPFPSYEQRDIFSCLINANKAFRNPTPADLYQERLKTIRWYEKHSPGQFELYGMGWGKPTPAFNLTGKVRRGLSSFGAKMFGYRPFPSYRGELQDKRSVMRRCKFSYCYENTRGPDNYITEKIFDCFLGGCVPVYWGPENVLEHIPVDCFIDRRKFKDTADVHQFLLCISAEEYNNYQLNMNSFLKSDAARRFSAEYFVSTVVEHILN